MWFLCTLVFTLGESQESSVLLQTKTWSGQFCGILRYGGKKEAAGELRTQLVAPPHWAGL